MEKFNWEPVGNDELIVTAPNEKLARKFMSDMLPKEKFLGIKKNNENSFIFNVRKDFEHDPDEDEIEKEEEKLEKWNKF